MFHVEHACFHEAIFIIQYQKEVFSVEEIL